MRGIRNIANTGRTIVMTSHQPSARLFSAFDMLLLLKFGGETVFFGPIGPDGENVVKYFEVRSEFCIWVSVPPFSRPWQP
jgi:ATP-binding cassette subfamily G (WHITE) protein 2 (SNQ2)